MEDDEIDSSSEDIGFGKLSRINSAMLINITLNDLWKDFFKHIRENLFSHANDDLNCIWMILGGEKGIKGKEDETDYNNITKKISDLGIPSNLFAGGFNKTTIKDVVRNANYKKVLEEKGLFLRRLQNKQGKGSAYHEGEEDYMD